jgi:Reverse transcriptase (RNA-dependent DNA polymerase)
VHLIFDVKHDLKHKAWLVAGGHLTDPPKDSAYSGVVSLRSLRLVALLAELYGLEFWLADVGNAYLEAYTKEKLYIIAGPEFGEGEGHMLIIVHALYGLRTSGARWHERLADVLHNLGFVPSQADPDVWMKDCGTHYEYICVYVDDLGIAMQKPSDLTDALIQQYGFKLKGVGPMKYHLGADIWRDKDGTLCFGAKTYMS